MSHYIKDRRGDPPKLKHCESFQSVLGFHIFQLNNIFIPQKLLITTLSEFQRLNLVELHSGVT